MKKIILFLLVVTVFASCTNTETNYVAKVKLLKLTSNDLFDKELVYDVIFDSEELKIDSLKNKSRQLFLKGVDLYKNKNNPAEAITLFKESILVFPDAKTYYELGNALLDAKDLKSDFVLSNADMALKAYDVAEYLKFQPASTIHYKKACAMNSLLGKSDKYSEYGVTYCLEQAFANGFTDTALLQKDEKINSILNTESYKKMKEALTLKKVDNPTTLFGMFLNSFPVTASGFYEINKEDVSVTTYDNSISYDYAKYVPEMQNVGFGRDVSHDFFYVAKLSETDNYTAVLYSSINFWGSDMQPVTTKLVTYNNEGNIISSINFAGQFSAEKIKTGKFENNKITVEDYKRTWKFPITEVSFDENEVTNYELTSKLAFVVDETGKINEASLSSLTKKSVQLANVK